MNERLLELAVRRGALQERIASQRETLAANAYPVADALGLADKAAAGVTWLRQRPGVVGGVVAGLVVLGPRRALRWGRRALFLWGSVQGLRKKLGDVR